MMERKSLRSIITTLLVVASSVHSTLSEPSLMPRSALQCLAPEDGNPDLSTRDLTPNSKAFTDPTHASLPLVRLVHGELTRLGFLSISTLNDGWHGRGIYLTHYPAYADFYVRVRGGASSPARSLLLSWVLHGKTYPVVGRMDKITFEVELERQEVDGRVYLCHEGKRLFRLTPGDPDVKHIAVPNPDPFTTWSLKADGQTAVGVFTGPEHPHHAGYPGHDSHYALVTEQGLTCTVFDPSPVYAFDEICALNPDNLLPLAVVDVLI